MTELFEQEAKKTLELLKACGGHWLNRVNCIEDALTSAYERGLERGAVIAESQCPNCGGDGFTVATESAHGCDGTEESCLANCPVPEQVQVQCDCVGAKVFAIRSEIRGPKP